MKFARASGTLSLAALAVIASPFAAAQDTGWYGGLNIGRSTATIDNARITSGLLGRGFTTTSIGDDDRDTGGKIFGGYRLNRNFALEGGYFDLGSFSFMATTLPTGTLSGSTKLRGLNLDAVGILPLTEKFSAFGRIGLNFARASDTFSGTGFVNVLNPNPSKRDTNIKYGLGMQYDFTRSVGLRLEAERYRINDAVDNKGDIDQVSLGLVVRFGADAPAPASRAAAPLPVAEASALPPQPVAVMTPPPARRPMVAVASEPAPAPVPAKVTISADSLFDFDKAIMKPEGTQHLDAFAANLKGADYDVITVTGYSDRIGPQEYNVELSGRRAEAVKAYLVESAGIPASKIMVSGKGEADPVTKPGDCKHENSSRKLIACLQPDRRVEVEVFATR